MWHGNKFFVIKSNASHFGSVALKIPTSLRFSFSQLQQLSPGLMPVSLCSALETLSLWWIMLKEHMQEKRGNTFTLMHANIHTHACTYTPYKHTQTPPRGVAWLGGNQRGPKECQGKRSKVKTIQGQTLTGTASPHLALGCVCVCVCVWECVRECPCEEERVFHC